MILSTVAFQDFESPVPELKELLLFHQRIHTSFMDMILSWQLRRRTILRELFQLMMSRSSKSLPLMILSTVAFQDFESPVPELKELLLFHQRIHRS
jgi:hypothetical protein